MSEEKSLNFIEQIITEDLASGKNNGRLHTRFPPEPNGYLHLGHASSICLNFGLTEDFGGLTNLRFDDTNPDKEEAHYVEQIKKDIKWLGFDWDDREYYASDYFPQLFDFACKLIEKGVAYVDESDAETISLSKGNIEVPGIATKYRERPTEESLRLFKEMKAGDHEEGSMVLRAKISLTSPNLHLRDPIIYRIKKKAHHRTGDEWNIYPMYDFAHGQSDSIEQITHSLCTLEFKNHRPLYNWFIKQLEIFPSRQIEFARRNINYTIMSKRKLLRLVEENIVEGWDDPRMPTIAGIRRRGYTAKAIRMFSERVGIAKRDNVVDMSLLEFCVREDLNKITDRRMVVENPLKLTITNYPDTTEMLTGENNPEEEEKTTREIPFSKHIFIERDDFMKDPPKKYFRMGPGRDVRLKHAYILHCESFNENEAGEVTEVFCTYYPDSRSGSDTSGVKAKGTMHWVDQSTSIDVEIRSYDRLFNDPTPDGHEGEDFIDFINPESLEVIQAKAEPALGEAKEMDKFQFLRKGYYVVDRDSTADKKVFNRTVSLRDSWAKKNK